MRHRLFCIECSRPVIVLRPNWGGVQKPRADHDLCQKCWKAEQDRQRVRISVRGGAVRMRIGR